MRQALAVVAFFAVTYLLGLWGMYDLRRDDFWDGFGDHAYRILQLYLVEGDWLDNYTLNWQLEVARFAAPVSTILSLILVFARDSLRRIQVIFARFRKGHIVVAGLGYRGWQFARSCREQGLSVVAVEVDPDNRNLDAAWELGIPVIIGNVLDDQALLRTGVAGAAHLVALSGSDGGNVELALRTRALLTGLPRNDPLKIYLHITDPDLTYRLEEYPKFFADASRVEMRFFNVYELSARLLFREQWPDLIADGLDAERVHLGIVGFGSLGENLLAEAVRHGHYRGFLRPRITVFDPAASHRELEVRASLQQLDMAAELDFVDIDIQRAGFPQRIAREHRESITQWFVCYDSDEVSLSIALKLRQATLQQPRQNAPIMLRMLRSAGLAELLESQQDDPEIPDGLYPFAMLDEVLSFDNVIDARLDRLAVGLHEEYRRSVAGSRTVRPWEALDERTRRRNRNQADYLPVLLRMANCRIEPDRAGTVQFTDAEVQLLAKLEHNRYVASQRLEGYRYGAARIEMARVNPTLVQWEELDASQQATECDRIRQMNSLAANLGGGLRRQRFIGVTGHRHRVDFGDPSLTSRLDNILRELQAKYPDEDLVIVSPLADGADRWIAQRAISLFGARLWVPLPMPYELYIEDFGETDADRPASIEEFKALLGRADQYFELPMRRSLAELAGQNRESGPARAQQYAWANAWIAQRCDELIAVYDGQPERGVGGAGELVRWISEGIPDSYRLRSKLLPERQPAAPIVIPVSRTAAIDDDAVDDERKEAI